MQDVIFGGGRGVQARTSAEVEIVLDNSDGTVALPLSEISILRRLDRSGEGEYRLNGARCRLGDVIEVLSDTGLGKETHSVISQGRVEAIVISKPRDRRLLIEEAAGLGKHRKRRRRAQLKLERTQENLDRALDVEREARTRLRPLKRQAEAAELHERLERQAARSAPGARPRGAARAPSGARGAPRPACRRPAPPARPSKRACRRSCERRSDAERALAERSERHDALARRALQAGAAHERLELRREQAAAAVERLAERDPPRAARAGACSRRPLPVAVRREADGDRTELGQRIGALEERARRAGARARAGAGARAGRARPRPRATPPREVAELDAALAEAREAREEADAGAEEARARCARPSARSRPPAARPRGWAPSSPPSTSSCAATRPTRRLSPPRPAGPQQASRTAVHGRGQGR